MADSSTALVNRALDAIGSRSQISSLLEQSPEARAAARIYTNTVESLLRAAQWNFALRQSVPLTQVAQSPLITGSDASPVTWSFMPWGYEYAYPSDCLRFVRIVPPFFGTPASPVVIPSNMGVVPSVNGQVVIPFKVGGNRDADGNAYRAIWTNQSQALGRYISSVPENMFDPQFSDAVVGSLAAQLCVPLSGNQAMAKLVIQNGEAIVAAAQAADGNEGSETQDHTPDWIAIRGNIWAPYGQGPYWPGSPFGWGGS